MRLKSRSIKQGISGGVEARMRSDRYTHQQVRDDAVLPVADSLLNNPADLRHGMSSSDGNPSTRLCQTDADQNHDLIFGHHDDLHNRSSR